MDKVNDGYCVEYRWKDEWTDTYWYLARNTCTLDYRNPFHYTTTDHDSAFRICKQNYICADPGLNWDF